GVRSAVNQNKSGKWHDRIVDR
ncbi:MAG: hypothetical protein QOD39_2621, partial [Mycobacterium sp.]|nr:hypothetical protein [Mycobacterium sp.]